MGLTTIVLFGLSALLGAPAASAEGKPAWAGYAAAQGAGHEHHHAGPSAGAREWTAYPLIIPAMGGGGDRSAATVKVKNLQAGVLEVFPPGGWRHLISIGPDGAKVEAAPKVGNYHWLVARDEGKETVTVASSAYYFGNPGPAPTQMLRAAKGGLEIVPQPLPREHGAWRESEKWPFLLRFNGQPLANRRVAMETEFGTKTAFTSDADGMVTVLFPRDFKPAEADRQGGHGGPRRAKFVLAAEHDDRGKHYLTAFNYTYSPDAERGRNLLAGVGFGLFGMLLATPLLRRKPADRNNGKESSC